MSSDAIVMLKQDHKEVARLFAEFERTTTTAARKKAIVTTVIEKLTVHTHLENTVFYPAVTEHVPALKDHILESYEEHHVVDLLTAELAGMDPSHVRYFPKFTVVMENVRHHVKEEEHEWFPQVRQAMSRTQLRDVGQAMADLKPGAPTSPAQPSALKKALGAIIN